MKICILSYSYPPNSGGGGFYAQDLAQALSKKGHRVVVYANRAKNFNDGNLQVKNVPSRSPHLIFFNLQLRKREEEIINSGFDVVLHNETSGVFLSKRFFNSQLDIMSFHHQTDKEFTLSTSRKVKLKIVQSLQSAMVKKADALVFLTGQTQKEAIKRYHLKKPTYVLPSMVTLPKVSKATLEPLGKPPMIFYPSGAGDNFERKGFIDFIPVLVKLNRAGLDFRVRVSGGNKNTIRIIKESLSKHGVDDKVVFTSNLTYDEVTASYLSADIIVFTSHYEGFGRPIIEALVAHKPLITFKVGVAPDVINSGVNGFIADDHADTYKFLKKLVADSSLRQRLGQSAGATDLSRFSEESIITKLEKIIKDLA